MNGRVYVASFTLSVPCCAKCANDLSIVCRRCTTFMSEKSVNTEAQSTAVTLRTWCVA